MLEIPQIVGVNAPIEHQRVIRKLSGEFHILYKEGKIQLKPFSETMIDSCQTSPAPDVLLWEPAVKKFRVFIEVSTSQGAKKDFRKLIDLMQDYDVPEGFVYDYENRIWFKYLLNKEEIKQDSSFCQTIAYDLNELLGD